MRQAIGKGNSDAAPQAMGDGEKPRFFPDDPEAETPKSIKMISAPVLEQISFKTLHSSFTAGKSQPTPRARPSMLRMSDIEHFKVEML